jgi:hypothetical protein
MAVFALTGWLGSQTARAGDIAPLGNGIMGYQAAVDSSPGTPLFHAGAAFAINDGDLTTHVDNYSGGSDNGEGVSFVGIIWPSIRYEQIQTLTLTLATFVDGGWFGPNNSGPGPGGALTLADLTEPTVQVSTNGGTSWTTVLATSDYLTALTGATIGGGANPNPNPLTANFTLTPAISNISGIRLIGTNGGTADGNGFIGVFELDVEGTAQDTDGDGIPDAWMVHYFGHPTGTASDHSLATDDADGDGLNNLQEFQAGTDPLKPDTDGDGLNDVEEVNTYHTSPVLADTDGDGLNDGAEVNTYHTDPLNPDTDGDGLSDGAEVNTYHTDPLNPDTDGDGYSDGVEVALGSNPLDKNSIPGNLALVGQGILGTEDSLGTDTPVANAGLLANINDGNLTTHVDDWNGGGTDPLSFVGITWTNVVTNAVSRLELTMATFLDGGWFGFNNKGPGAGGQLNSKYLKAPAVQVSFDNGLTWSNVAYITDYLTAFDGHGIGGGTNPNPSSASAVFTLVTPIKGISGIRLLGSEGGTASDGFIGVYELGVYGFTDSDNDGIPDAWTVKYFGHPTGQASDKSRATDDPDGDGLTNLQEYQAGTNPLKADTDGDGLSDGAEVNTTHTNPLAPDSDGDGLSDGDELNKYRTNPLLADSDGDGFPDALEVKLGSDPNNASSIPSNLAFRDDASGILGTEDMPGGTDTPVFNAGSAANINDGDLTTRVDTYNGTGSDTLSFVGIVWTNAVTNTIQSMQLSLATFFDGGWFGTNNMGPGAGSVLNTNQYLAEPWVEVSHDGGLTWSNVTFTSDYLTALDGHPLPAVAFGLPTLATANFQLTPSLSGINGIRIIGSEGGTASSGFLGVFELAVLTTTSGQQATPPTMLNPRSVAGQFQFEFDSQGGTSYTVQFKNTLNDPDWQTLTFITGDGTRKLVADSVSNAQRFYRIKAQ